MLGQVLQSLCRSLFRSEYLSFLILMSANHDGLYVVFSEFVRVLLRLHIIFLELCGVLVVYRW